ncbi:hypothetical protein OSTOST_00389 [Ostertagia ostertagi]
MDLPSALAFAPDIKVYAFADDVKAFTSFDSGQFANMPTLMNDVLSRMSSWTHEWGLKLNFAKTCVLTLGKRLPHFAIEGLPPSSIVSQARDLGDNCIEIDELGKSY